MRCRAALGTEDDNNTRAQVASADNEGDLGEVRDVALASGERDGVSARGHASPAAGPALPQRAPHRQRR